MHALRTQCTRSAHAVRSFECRPILRPYFWPLLTSFWFHAGFFFSFLCIWNVAHLNCHPLLPNVNHFYPFSVPHIELSPLWGPREGTGDVAIHSPRTSLAINKCVATTLRTTTALPFTLFAVPITQETTDNAFPTLRVKGHLIAASKSEATGTETLEASGLYKAEWFVHRDSGVRS